MCTYKTLTLPEAAPKYIFDLYLLRCELLPQYSPQINLCAAV